MLKKTETEDSSSPIIEQHSFKEKLKNWAKRWFIDAFSGMAMGLFATLIAGTILAQIGSLINLNGANAVGNLIISVSNMAKLAMGAGIGIGIAYYLKTDKLTMFTCAGVGLIGALSKGWLNEFTLVAVSGIPGNPIGAYVAVMFVIEINKLVAGKTKLDIIIIPLLGLIVACVIAVTLCPPITLLLKALADGIIVSINWSPLIMGIVIAVVMGLLLTLPTSSAAIWVSICLAYANTTANALLPPELLLAGGAAVVGCSCQMVGFATMSYKENGISGLISQGLGTSMLQIPNLMKNGKILIPPVVASAICGALSTTVFKLYCGADGGGMGTSGLVGVISTISNSVGVINPVVLALGIVLLMFVLPTVICVLLTMLLKKIGWIGENDLRLEL